MRFTKMHGLGNDYVYVNGFVERVENPGALSVAVSRPHYGIGADGLILVLPSDRADFRMRVFNSDGSEAAMCGNGARCVGRFVFEKGLTDRTRFTLETGGGLREVTLALKAGRVAAVSVDMGAPQAVQALDDAWTYVSMGNPHRVTAVDTDPFAWPDFAALAAPRCAEADANIEYVQCLASDRLRMRVFERGSGETFACGSGACASVVAMHARGLCGPQATVEMRGGCLDISLRAADGHVLMKGPAVTVFEGDWLGEEDTV